MLRRDAMINGQIRPCCLLDHELILAFKRIPRELFLPPSFYPIAYADYDLAYHESRVLTAPKVLAQLIESAAIETSSRVLVVGCGTGYSLAILSALCERAIGLENIPLLAQQAQKNINTLNLATVSVIEGALEQGIPEEAPFDVIVVEGTVSYIPQALKEQISDYGGRLVALMKEVSSQDFIRGLILKRHQGTFTCLKTFDAVTQAPLVFPNLPDPFVL